jgi:GDP-L-fucose synthase
MNKNSKIYISGHTGFVGKKLYSKLKEFGYTNLLVSNRKDLDLTNQAQVKSFLSKHKPEYVFALAAKVGGIQANINDPYHFLYDNLSIQNNVINYSIENKVKKVLFLGSSCIYPCNYKQPLKEEYLLKDLPEPTNEGYSIAKIAGLKLCEYGNKTSNTKFVSLMSTNLYGPGDPFDPLNSHALSAITKKVVDAHRMDKKSIEIWGTGSAKREWLYIDDLVDCMLWAINNNNINTYVNVGTGVDISIKDLTLKICEMVGYKGKVIFDKTKPEGMKRKLLDVSKIKKLGWKAKTNFDTGLTNTIHYYQDMSEPILTTMDMNNSVYKNVKYLDI